MSTHRHWYVPPQADEEREAGTRRLIIQEIEEEDCDGSYEAEMKRIGLGPKDES